MVKITMPFWVREKLRHRMRLNASINDSPGSIILTAEATQR